MAVVGVGSVVGSGAEEEPWISMICINTTQGRTPMHKFLFNFNLPSPCKRFLAIFILIFVYLIIECDIVN